MKLKYCLVFIALLCVTGYVCSAPVSVKCNGFKPSLCVNSAIEDLQALCDGNDVGSLKRCVFKVDKHIEDGSFGYEIKKNEVCFLGGDEASVAHACYTFMEDLGCTFDFGCVTKTLKVTSINQLRSRMVKPRVRWRGIRQHVNFPMDISSYSIEDAKAYVRSLQRMRFNKLVIHSYPGQWYETHFGDSIAYAGHFFYGDTHYVGNNKWLNEQVASNDSVFCIPEAERCFNDKAKRSQFAIDWMQQLVDYACDLGFYVQISFEPRSTTVEQAVTTAKDIIRTYPRIKALELITEETGGWGPGCVDSQVKATLKKYFAEEIVTNDEVLAPIKPKQSDLNALYEQIGINVNAIKILQSDVTTTGIELKLGIYSSITDYTRGAYRLARLAMPETQVCLMPSHGSTGTAAAVKTLINDPSDMRRTELYSWIEFDGLMYLYQNSVEGNSELMNHIEGVMNEEQMGSLLFNHWRTAENRTSARYAMQSTLQGKCEPALFYEEYAKRLSIADVSAYCQAMELLNAADNVARKYLGNIGFCWVGAWRSGGSFVWANVEQVKNAREHYLEAGQLLQTIIEHTSADSPAYDYLSLIGNRVLCSIVYLDAFVESAKIREIPKQADGTYTEENKLKVEQCCSRALVKMDQYMKIFAKMMPDRGCEGTLVSVWNAPTKGLKKYMKQVLGEECDNMPMSSDAIDAPPLPIFYEVE
ncbi:MAG: hypothetical protein ACI4AH_05965 [Muribaculaceae bacterium]